MSERTIVLTGIRIASVTAAVMFVAACVGFDKRCASLNASNVGSDWIVVQYDTTGRPFLCWKLRGAFVTGTQGGQVDWQDPRDSHLVHITGWENRVQVVRGDFDGAARLIGVDASQCDNGVYPSLTGGAR